MSDWWTEGTAHRSPVQYNPIIHVLVQQAGEWVLWCSSGKGRENYVPHATRFCGKCRALVLEAVADETADPDEFDRWIK